MLALLPGRGVNLSRRNKVTRPMARLLLGLIFLGTLVLEAPVEGVAAQVGVRHTNSHVAPQSFVCLLHSMAISTLFAICMPDPMLRLGRRSSVDPKQKIKLDLARGDVV